MGLPPKALASQAVMEQVAELQHELDLAKLELSLVKQGWSATLANLVYRNGLLATTNVATFMEGVISNKFVVEYLSDVCMFLLTADRSFRIMVEDVCTAGRAELCVYSPERRLARWQCTYTTVSAGGTGAEVPAGGAWELSVQLNKRQAQEIQATVAAALRTIGKETWGVPQLPSSEQPMQQSS
jgi:hypothetical protein